MVDYTMDLEHQLSSKEIVAQAQVNAVKRWRKVVFLQAMIFSLWIGLAASYLTFMMVARFESIDAVQMAYVIGILLFILSILLKVKRALPWHSEWTKRWLDEVTKAEGLVECALERIEQHSPADRLVRQQAAIHLQKHPPQPPVYPVRGLVFSLLVSLWFMYESPLSQPNLSPHHVAVNSNRTQSKSGRERMINTTHLPQTPQSQSKRSMPQSNQVVSQSKDAQKADVPQFDQNLKHSLIKEKLSKSSEAKSLEAKTLETKTLEAKTLEAKSLEAKTLEAKTLGQVPTKRFDTQGKPIKAGESEQTSQVYQSYQMPKDLKETPTPTRFDVQAVTKQKTSWLKVNQVEERPLIPFDLSSISSSDQNLITKVRELRVLHLKETYQKHSGQHRSHKDQR